MNGSSSLKGLQGITVFETVEFLVAEVLVANAALVAKVSRSKRGSRCKGGSPCLKCTSTGHTAVMAMPLQNVYNHVFVCTYLLVQKYNWGS